MSRLPRSSLALPISAAAPIRLEEVVKLKEEDWFSRGVALARPCNQHIVDSSLQRLEELRQSGTQHQLIAVACSINHAREIRSLYRERGSTAEVIHSKQPEDEQEAILTALRNGTLDCIIQVQMLGEGFDHPKLSVAAIFPPIPVAWPLHSVRRPYHPRGRPERSDSSGQCRAYRDASRHEPRRAIEGV